MDAAEVEEAISKALAPAARLTSDVQTTMQGEQQNAIEARGRLLLQVRKLLQGSEYDEQGGVAFVGDEAKPPLSTDQAVQADLVVGPSPAESELSRAPSPSRPRDAAASCGDKPYLDTPQARAFVEAMKLASFDSMMNGHTLVHKCCEESMAGIARIRSAKAIHNNSEPSLHKHATVVVCQ